MATSLYDRDVSSLESHRTLRWAAVFGGLAVALGTQILMTAIGAALGITAAASGGGTSTGFGIGAGIWMILSPLVSLFAGGFAASWIARPATRRIGAFHGIVVWCLATVLGAYLFGSFASMAVGAAGSVAGTAVSAAGEAAGSGQVDRQELEQEIEQQRQQLGEAQARLQRTGEQAADVSAGVAWATVLAMLLSLGAAIVGGMSGFRAGIDEDLERRLVREERVPTRVTPEEPLHPTDLH